MQSEDDVYHQRHRSCGVWSRWYKSSRDAYREDQLGPVGCFEVVKGPVPQSGENYAASASRAA